jgi:integrase
LRNTSLVFGEKSHVKVQSSLVPVDGRQQFRETTKGRRPRTVPIPASIATLLAAHVGGASSGRLVFTSPSGAELRSSNFARRVLHPAIERCQAEDATFPRIVFHDLRRTAVSLAISAGANVKVVQQIAGHKSAVTTMDVYAQHYEDDLHSSAKAVDGLLSAG